MRIDTYFTVPEVDGTELSGSTVVVIDVLRATTTIVEALANGAREIFPTESTEDAVKLVSSLGREDSLLCGERKAEKVEGFDLGNSPHEFTSDVVAGKKVVMNIAHVTRALRLAQEGDRVLPCALTNLGSVAEELLMAGHISIICIGQEDTFSLDDALCAGHLIERVLAGPESKKDEDPELNDAARAVRAFAQARKPTKRFLSLSAAGRAVIGVGLEDDLALCADVDRHDVLVEMVDQSITRVGE